MFPVADYGALHVDPELHARDHPGLHPHLPERPHHQRTPQGAGQGQEALLQEQDQPHAHRRGRRLHRLHHAGRHHVHFLRQGLCGGGEHGEGRAGDHRLTAGSQLRHQLRALLHAQPHLQEHFLQSVLRQEIRPRPASEQQVRAQRGRDSRAGQRV